MFLEREWGWVWFLTTYITAGLGGTLLSCILQPHDVGVGATGAVAVCLERRRRKRTRSREGEEEKEGDGERMKEER